MIFRCGDSWLQYTEEFLDPDTGQPTGILIRNMGQADRKCLHTISQNMAHLSQFLLAHGNPVTGVHFSSNPMGYYWWQDNICKDPGTIAESTLYSGPLNGITLCPRALNSRDTTPGEGGLGTGLDFMIGTKAATLLHEIMHHVSHDIIDHAYGVRACLDLAQGANTEPHLNADSYAAFAFAMKYDLFDWASGIALPKPPQPVRVRRDNSGFFSRGFEVRPKASGKEAST
jgi:hypothetical protein